GPRTHPLPLISEIRCLLEVLVMVDSEDASARWEEARLVMPHGCVPLEAPDICRAEANRNAIQLGFWPSDRKSNRRVEENAEVIRVIGKFPEVLAIGFDVFAEGLAQSDVVLIAMAGLERRLALCRKCIDQNRSRRRG